MFQVFLCSLLCLSPSLVQSAEIRNRTFVLALPAHPVQLGECPSKWKYDNKDVDNFFSATQSHIGFYHCADDEHLVYVLARDVIVFTQVEASKLWYMTGDTTTFNCQSKVYMGGETKYSIKLEITDPSGTQLSDMPFNAENVKDQKEFNLTHDHIFVGYGIQMFFCSMHYNMQKGDTWKITHSEFKTLNITVYQIPQNIRPNTLSVELGKDVTCMSEGYPNPEYKWVCQGDGWTTNRENLTVQAELLICVCNARLTIDGKTHEGSWNGTIRGTAGGAKIFITGILIIATALAHLPDA